jgi:hypothetical protein
MNEKFRNQNAIEYYMVKEQNIQRIFNYFIN